MIVCNIRNRTLPRVQTKRPNSVWFVEREKKEALGKKEGLTQEPNNE